MVLKVDWSLVSGAEFSKLVKTKLDYTNLNAWRAEVVYGLRVSSCAQHIRMDDGVAEGFENLLYEWPVGPAMECCKESVKITAEYIAKQNKYDVEMAAYLKRKSCVRTRERWTVSVYQMRLLLLVDLLFLF